MNLHPPPPSVRQIEGLGEIAGRYDAILCDIWGVVHNGVAAFAPACDALVAFRRRGGAVILISNAPRPSAPIDRQLARLGVPHEAFDAVVTSGDVTVEMIKARIDDPVLHIGPERDLSLFDAAAEAAGRQPKLVSLAEARYSVCTGLRNDVSETVDDYAAELGALAASGLVMICANPDVVIHRGDTLIYCAGALARHTEELGGEVVYAGKPYPPIYARALALAEGALGRPLKKARALAIGDGMRTDIAGAAAADLDALFITGGIHRAELHGDDLGRAADPHALRRLCAEYGLFPAAATRALRN
ncbi:MAG: TIGR01459 family HAD-type hydrolase [Hyphomicrobiales bacterium]|nr:TIGR01459 family HAD-type hydrolase [Hyphomicrobiales bacterium]